MNTRRAKLGAFSPYLLSAGMLILTAAFLFHPARAFALDSVQEVLAKDSLNIGKIHKGILDAVNSIIIVFLIVMAFAEILRLKVDTYGFKKFLPSLIFAIIAANFSYLLCRLMIDLANVVMSLLIENVGSIQGSSNGIVFGQWETTAKSTVATQPFLTMFLTLIMLVVTVMTYILAYLLIIRNYVIYFLVVLAPLAFMATAIPQGKSVFNQWWSNFAKWTFMPVVSIFWIWLAARFIDQLDASGGEYLKQIYAIVCYYLAITTPWKMGGAVMSQWGNFGKKMWGRTGGAALGAAKKAWVDEPIDELKNRARTWYLHQANKGAPTEGGEKESLKDQILGQTIGRYVRRSYRVKDRRTDMKKAVEGAEDSAYREAFGGKTIEYIDENGKKVVRARFLSNKDQIAIGKRKDDIASDFGEKDWILKHLDNMYKQTQAGNMATARSVAYGFRMENAENISKKIRAQVEAAFDLEEKDKANIYRANPEWNRMYTQALESRELYENAKRTQGKARGDAISENALAAGKLQELKFEFDTANKQLGKIADQLRSLDRLEELERKGSLTDTERAEKANLEARKLREKWGDRAKLEGKRGNITEGRDKIKEWWGELRDDIVSKYYDEQRGRMAGPAALAQDILTNKNGVFSTTTSIEDATSLTDDMPEEEQTLAMSRWGKRYSELFKEELQSTVGKRDQLKSGLLVFKKWMDPKNPKRMRQVLSYIDGQRNGLDPVFERKIFAEIAHAIDDASGETLVRTREMYTDLQVKLALGEYKDEYGLDGEGARRSLVEQSNVIFRNDANDTMRRVMTAIIQQKNPSIKGNELLKAIDTMQQAAKVAGSAVQTQVIDALRESYESRLGLTPEQSKLLDISIDARRGIPTVKFAEDIDGLSDAERTDQVMATALTIDKSGFGNERNPEFTKLRGGYTGSKDVIAQKKQEPHTVIEDSVSAYQIDTP